MFAQKLNNFFAKFLPGLRYKEKKIVLLAFFLNKAQLSMKMTLPLKIEKKNPEISVVEFVC